MLKSHQKHVQLLTNSKISWKLFTKKGPRDVGRLQEGAKSFFYVYLTCIFVRITLNSFFKKYLLEKVLQNSAVVFQLKAIVAHDT